MIVTAPDNTPPAITITHPPASGATADTSYTIRWTDSDPDSNAIISLYYDTDNTGYDGTLIVTGIPEDDPTDAYVWDCSAIPNGTYYIYAKITDGVNPPIYDYSDGALTIFHGPQDKKRWTFMVYIGSDNNLEDAGIDDLNEMEMVGSSDKVNIIVQFDRIPGYDSSNGNWTTTRRYHVTKDNNPNIINSQLIADLGELNMADPATLRDFALWGIQNYPAENYALVLWNHGNGWREAMERLKAQGVENPERAICWDDTSGYDCLYMKEVKTALSQIVSQAGTKIHLVGFDACLMGMIEVAYEIKDHALVAVGAEDVEPWDGWPYDTILADLVKSPNMTPAQLGEVIVKRYGQFYSNTPWTTQSAVDLTKMAELSTIVSSFADSMNSYWNQIKQARNTTQQYYYPDHVDLYHFADRISKLVPNTEMVNKANMVKDRVKTAVIAEWHGSYRPNSHGLAIYFPKTSVSYYYNSSVIDFPKDTTWDEFLKRFVTKAKAVVPMPKIERVVIRDLTQIDVHFDGEVPIEVSPVLFDISQADDPKVKIDVTEVRIDRKDDRLVHLTTSPLVEGKFYVVSLRKIRDFGDIPDTSLEFGIIKSGTIKKGNMKIEIPVGTFNEYIALYMRCNPTSDRITEADRASSSRDTRITLLVPDTAVEIIGYRSSGKRLEQDSFKGKVRLTISYKDRYLEQDELSLRIFHLDEAGSRWVLVPGRQEVDYTNNTVTCSIGHFSIYRIAQTSGPAAANLKDVKVYPNPYKPSELHHTYIIFKNLTDNVKIRVFNIAGELVYEKELDRGGEWKEWQGTNNEGEKLASGIYIYIITNDKGETAKGKLSIIK
ncbi:TPA: hypothetical protein DCX15_05905 [bacterium]|nr:hypothetical protein [bacterium]